MKQQVLLLFILTATPLITYSQEKITGLLFLFKDNEAIGHNLFLPCALDTALSFHENIKQIKADTLRRISFSSDKMYPQMVPSARFMTNEAEDHQQVKVVAIETQYGQWVTESRGIGEKDFIPYPLKIFGTILSPGYIERRQWMLMYVRKLNLK